MPRVKRGAGEGAGACQWRGWFAISVDSARTFAAGMVFFVALPLERDLALPHLASPRCSLLAQTLRWASPCTAL